MCHVTKFCSLARVFYARHFVSKEVPGDEVMTFSFNPILIVMEKKRRQSVKTTNRNRVVVTSRGTSSYLLLL